jgi:hypothetical protein
MMMRTQATKVFSIGMITGSFLTAGTVFLASPAKADSVDDAICSVLAEYPSVDGVLGIGLALKDEGYSGYDAGRAIGVAVYGTCPEFIPLVKRFIAIYGDSAAVA